MPRKKEEQKPQPKRYPGDQLLPERFRQVLHLADSTFPEELPPALPSINDTQRVFHPPRPPRLTLPKPEIPRHPPVARGPKPPKRPATPKFSTVPNRKQR
ncbi:MAG TPA: hypothetical protein VFU76_09655 [Terriglobales bacterium]|nr:hypothetical protein [Terriglobales bacterium]